MYESNEAKIQALRAQKAALKLKIHALIHRQYEILEFLSYSLDQEKARKNHKAYSKAIHKNARLIDSAMDLILDLDKHIANLSEGN